MDNFTKLKEEQTKTLQDMAQKYREYINTISQNEEEREDLMLATSVEFFNYALSSSNEQFISVDIEKIFKLFKKHRELVLSSIIEIAEE